MHAYNNLVLKFLYLVVFPKEHKVLELKAYTFNKQEETFTTTGTFVTDFTIVQK
jgi:hypothetical protein